jgi:DNA-directed RNA polymerase subunit RPC12/RpoP
MIKCDKCKLDTSKYNLRQKEDIGLDCPECGIGNLMLIGFCPECNNKIKMKENKEFYRCENCIKNISKAKVMFQKKAN